ncbi:MAG: hypothetical protein KKD44_18935 [Proteobacteria bacterium]|nr:hypothetical protein [Pseudomonadota bacterium]
MQSPLDQLKHRIAEISNPRIPRGELWLGTQLFKVSGFDDTMDNHVRLSDSLDHAMVCLSVSDDVSGKPDLGYRYFTCSDLSAAARAGDKPVFAVIDGPFQEMVNTMGVMQVLTEWVTNREDLVRAYEAESEKCLALISRVLEHAPAAVVITDDMAFDNGPLVSPWDLDALCSPFYSCAVKRINESGSPVFFHSCGNVTKLIPIIKSWQIDGFAAIQSGVNDLENLYHQFESKIMIMGGIENDLLEPYPFPLDAEKKLDRLLSVLGTTGNLILGSSSGLYKGEYLDQVKRIYEIADCHKGFNSKARI